MKKIMPFLLVLIFILTITFIYAQEDEYEAPPGMEIKKVGNLKLVVPKGAKVEEAGGGGLLMMESTSEYASRKFLEMEERFEKIEKYQEELKKEIEQLKEAVSKLQANEN